MLKFIFLFGFSVLFAICFARVNIQKRIGDNHQYCCRVQVQDVIRNFTHTVPVEHWKNVTYMVTNGTRICEWGEKPVYWDIHDRYCENKVAVVRQELVYQLETVVKSVYEKGVCPSDQVICCQGYQEHLGNCYTAKELAGLNALAGLEGLLGRRR